MKLSRLSHLLAAAIFSILIFFPGAIAGKPQDATAISGFNPARVAAERELETKLRSIPDTARAEDDLRHLTSQPHMAGTEASHRVAEWLLSQYRSYGFDAEIVTYNAWLPQPREVSLEMTKPVAKQLATPEQPFPQDKDTYDKRAVAGFNIYSPSGEVTAPVVYVNYGMPDDYDKLAALGVSVEGKIVLARYGIGYRGIKAKLAEEHKAVGLVIYSDPVDDGAPVGETFPNGPWRPMSGIQRGSVMYTQIYPGDPLTAGVGATPAAASGPNRKVAPADAANLPHIPTMPINAQDAAVILEELRGPPVPRGWQGGLPISYHVGPGDAELHMKLVMDYRERPIYDVIAKLHGSTDDQWVILGNHHDAWVFGAADPGSGTASMLETARALGDLARSGWKPRRTIVICAWDAEEPGLIGSTAWVEANRAELQAKAVAYINTDMGVTGPGFAAASTPSLRDLVRDVTRDVNDPNSGLRVYEAWSRHAESSKQASSIVREMPMPDTSGEVMPGTLGSGSDFSPFFDYAGIPSVDVGFEGDYGVYHSLYDDFYWMKHFGDPSFVYHATLARILGTMALRLDEADFLPFNYPAYGTEIEHRVTDLFLRATRDADQDNLMAVLDASAHLSASAQEAARELRAISGVTLDPKINQQINHALASVEQQLLAPEGLTGRPWFKNTIYAPGTYAGYAAEAIPGIREALDRNDSAMLAHEASSLTAALLRASARLDEVMRMAQAAGKSARPGN